MKIRSHKFQYLFVAVMSVIMLYGLSSCGASRSASSRSIRAQETGKNDGLGGSGKKTSPDKGVNTTPTPAHIDFAAMSLSAPAEKLLREAETWIGTPYVYGGNGRQGIDCSGFVLQVFRNSVGISLPRTSREQYRFCTEIDKTQLQPGDLVFFTIRGGSTVGHVGIYIGDGNMIHASSSRGVIISSLSTNYNVVNYYGSGRVEKFFAMTGSDKGSRNNREATEAVKTKKTSAMQAGKTLKPAADLVNESASKPPVASVEQSADAVRQAIAMRLSKLVNTTPTASGATPVTVASSEDTEDPDSGLEDFFD